MLRKPLAVFFAVMVLLVAGALWFVQSATFARAAKDLAARHLPPDLGIEGDFSEFAIRFFPPGIALKNARAFVREKKNVLDLPPGSSVVAGSVDLIFRPLQMVSGNIRINEVAIVDGEVKLVLPAAGARPRKPREPLKWDDLLEVRADGFVLENTKVAVFENGADPSVATPVAELLAQTLKIGQKARRGLAGYEVQANLAAVKLDPKRAPHGLQAIDRVIARGMLSSSGAEIEGITVIVPGAELIGSGQVRGNLLDPRDLGLEANLVLKARLEQVVVPLLDPGSAPQLSGDVEFSGAVRGTLDAKFLQTATMEGTLKAAQTRVQEWKLDSVVAEGSLARGELRLSRAVIETAEETKWKGLRPGSGGRIEVGAFKMPLFSGGAESVSIPLTLGRAHIHWLAAPVLSDVYPLDFRINGPMHVTLARKPLNVQAKLDFSIEQFLLDNQRLGKERAHKQVLRVSRIRLEGPVGVDSNGVKLTGLTLSMPKSKFKVTGGIDFKKGHEFTATGTADLDDVGEIAENRVRGTGTVSARIHGPTQRTLIDFDADLKDAYYLRLQLGALAGRITFDEDPSHLIFGGVRVTQGRSISTVEGMLDLGDANSVNLTIQAPQATVQDYNTIFQELVANVDWYPRTLTGGMRASGRVVGGLGMDRLEIAADISGNNWEYLGERFRVVGLKGGYDKGRYHLSELKAVKENGKIAGRISFDEYQRRTEWEFKTQDFAISDLDRIARLDVPIRGRLSVASSGSGREGSIRSSTEIGLSDLSVRGSSMPASQLVISSESGLIRAKGSALGGQGTLDLVYDDSRAGGGGQSALRAELRGLDFSPVLLLLNPTMIQDPELAGRISGSVQLGFSAGKVERASGRLELTDYVLAKTGTRFRLSKPVSVRMTDGSFELPALTIEGDQGSATLRLQGRNAALEGSVTGELDIGIAEFFTPTIQKATGTASLDFALGGIIKAPTVIGRLKLNGASVQVASIETPFENATGTMHLRQNVLNVQGVEADLSGGRISAGGTIELFAHRLPVIALKGQLRNPKIKVYPFQFLKLQGDLAMTGEGKPYLIEGNVRVDSGLSKEKIAQRSSRGLKTLQYTPSKSWEGEGDSSFFRLRINASADRGILIQNELIDAEAKGNITVVNTLEAPRLLGTAEIVQGKVLFKDHQFQIQSASATFDSPTTINPSFNVTSFSDVSGVKVQLYATGRFDKPKIELSSVPVMPESEILSLLALGLTSNEVRRLSATERSAFEQSEAASLILHSLDFNREVQNKTGFNIQLDESIDQQSAQSIFRPQTQTDTGSAPKIVIKKQIGRNLDLSAGSTVGVGSNSQREVNAEYKVTPGFSVIGVWDSYETSTTEDKRTSFGLDLKVQRRFK